MKALIIDGEELYRLSLREVIRAVYNFSEIIEAGSEHEFLAKTASHTDISLIVLHPDSLKNQGAEWIRLIKRLYPGVATIVITNQASMAAGHWIGSTALLRTVSVTELAQAIRKSLRLPYENLSRNKQSDAPSGIQRTLNSEFGRFQQNIDAKEPAIDLTRLSHRQKQILAMAADGLPNKEIAARLSIAEGTVKAHMHAIFKVLGVSNRTQAVIRYGASSHQIGGSSESTRSATPKHTNERGMIYSY